MAVTSTKLLLAQFLSCPRWISPKRTHVGYMPYEGPYKKNDTYFHHLRNALK